MLHRFSRMRATIGSAIVLGLSFAWTAAAQSAPAGAVRSPATSAAARSPRLVPRSSPSYRLLYSFGSTKGDGADPQADLVAYNGLLYGTTAAGGAFGNGTVFALSPDGREQVLYSFKGAPDGAGPAAGLTLVNGTFYGTTRYGGSCYRSDCYGTVFKISPSGHEQVLFRFNGPDGGGPRADMVYLDGALFGTTWNGRGSVFEIGLGGNHRIVHNFTGPPDGQNPLGGLVVAGGAIYGTTQFGGAAYSCGSGTFAGCGTVFEVNPPSGESVLYTFNQFAGTQDAQFPNGLASFDGQLYGSSAGGGQYGNGTVFEAYTSGAERVVYSFEGFGDGATPEGGLVGFGNAVYGTATCCGAPSTASSGSVFALTAQGAFSQIHDFAGTPDGAVPAAALTRVGTTLYGTTSTGGASGKGSVFTVTP